MPPDILFPDLDAANAGDPSAAAEAERQRLYDEADQYQWQGKALRPWSLRLQRTLNRLLPFDTPLPPGKISEHPGAWVPRAVQVLYLCSVEPDEWRPLLPHPARLLAAMEAWGEANVPEADELPAVLLALRLMTAHEQVQPINRPGRREGRALGESPSRCETVNTASCSPASTPASPRIRSKTTRSSAAGQTSTPNARKKAKP